MWGAHRFRTQSLGKQCHCYIDSGMEDETSTPVVLGGHGAWDFGVGEKSERKTDAARTRQLVVHEGGLANLFADEVAPTRRWVRHAHRRPPDRQVG